MRSENIVKTIAETCIQSALKDHKIDLCDMWRGRASVFFRAILELSGKVDLHNDPSILWDLTRLASYSDDSHKLRSYLVNLPGFTFDNPASLISFSQHLSLITKFDKIVIKESMAASGYNCGTGRKQEKRG